MSEPDRRIIKRLNRIPGRAYLLLATIIFATANPVTRKLMDIGAQNLVSGRNPISFCNVLFVGNLCALAILIAIYRHQLNSVSLRQLSGRNLPGLLAVAILSGALAPALIFAALQTTAVNNVILIGRIEPPLVLALSVVLLKARVNLWVVAGALFSFTGVALTVILQSPEANAVEMMGLQIGRGELMAAAGAIASAIASIISQVTLQQISLGLFNLVRTAIGTIVFFVTAVKLFGTIHFVDAFSPFVWKWMILYGAVIVVGGQLCWFAGLRNSHASELSLVSSFNPIAGILAAYLILRETPTASQYIGGIIVFTGIVLNQVGITRQVCATSLTTATQATLVQKTIEKEMEIGFRGL